MNDDRKVKVLHVDNSTDYTGAFRALNDFMKDQSITIDSVIILPNGSKCISYLEGSSIKTYEVPFLEINKSIKAVLFYFPVLIKNAWRIKKIIQKEEIDVLHSNDLYNMAFYASRFLFGVKQPIVTHVRLMPSGYNSLLYNIWKKIHLHSSDKIIAVSQAVKKSFEENAIDVVYDAKLSVESHPDYKVVCDEDRPFRFLYLSNYIYGKGNDLCLEAFIQVLKKNKNVTLTFAGGLLENKKNVIFKSQLIQRAEEAGVSQYVFFEDFVKDTEAKMKAYDTVLNFSISESFSMTCFDALRFGVPLIASDSGGPSELFEDKISGLLVKNKSLEEMTAAMELIMNDCKLRENLSKNSKMHIAKVVSKNNNFDYLTRLITQLANERH